MKDLISRQAAIEAIKEDKIDLTNPNIVAVFKATGDFEKVETQIMTCDRHIEILKDLPSERKHGKWVKIPNDVFAPIVVCSNCSQTAIVDLYGEYQRTRYCPNCGTDMLEVDDETD